MIWNAYLTDNFNRANTSTGGAGTTTGVGNGWIDRVGGNGSIASNTLVLAKNAFTTDWIVRPTSENQTGQRIVWTFGAGSVTNLVFLRANSASDNAYYCYYDDTVSLHVGSLLGGAFTPIVTGPGFAYSSSASYILDFAVTGTSPTTYAATLYNAAAPTTAIATVTGSDSTAALQAAGSYAVARGSALAGPQLAVLYNQVPGAVPGTLSESSHTASSATLAWTAATNGAGAVTAQLQRSAAGANSWSDVAGATTSPATDAGLPPSVAYDYRVSYTDTAPATTYSNVVTVTTSASGTTMACSPTTFPMGVATAFTLTRTAGSAWAANSTASVTGGSAAFVSNQANPDAATITGTLNPGSAAGPLVLHNSSDLATASVSASAAITGNVVFHGDSLTYGSNGAGAGSTAATRLAAVLAGLGPGWQGSNQGGPGANLGDLAVGLATTVNGLYDASKTYNVLVVQGGHNDLAQGQTVATVQSRLSAYLSQALGAHPWLIVWSTEPPAGYTSPALFDSMRGTVNAWLRANWRTMSIAALSDFGADRRTGLDGCEFNATYYGSDHIHCTDAGYAIWGQYDLAAVRSVVASGSLAATTVGGVRRASFNGGF